MNNFRLQLPNFNSKFGAILLAITIALAAVGLGGWWWLQRNSPLNIQAELLHTPAAAKFLPRKANLSLYLQLDPNQLPAYGRAIATAKQRKNAALALAELRNNLFAITGLNYNSELSDWLGSETALALLTNSNPQEQPNWILALSSRTPMGAREFLQRFWQNRSLAGGDLEISSYRGLGLISSSDPKAPLATALINDQLVLLASQREALEDALDSSQVDALNQASDLQLQGWLQQQRKGVALLRSDATGISELLGFPAQLVAAEQLEELVGSIALKGRGLQLTAEISTGLERADLPLGNQATHLLQQLKPSVNKLSISNNSLKSFLPVVVAQPGPLLTELQNQGQTPLLLALLDNQDQWLAATPEAQPSPAALDEPLHRAGFDPTSIDKLQVWSRLSGQSDRDGKLKAILAGASGSKADLRWWSNNLDALQNQLEANAGNKNNGQLAGNTVAVVQLGAKPTRKLLGSWSFWQGLQLVAARPLSPALGALEYSLEEDQTNLGLKATLRFS